MFYICHERTERPSKVKVDLCLCGSRSKYFGCKIIHNFCQTDPHRY